MRWASPVLVQWIEWQKQSRRGGQRQEGIQRDGSLSDSLVRWASDSDSCSVVNGLFSCTLASWVRTLPVICIMKRGSNVGGGSEETLAWTCWPSHELQLSIPQLAYEQPYSHPTIQSPVWQVSEVLYGSIPIILLFKVLYGKPLLYSPSVFLIDPTTSSPPAIGNQTSYILVWHGNLV